MSYTELILFKKGQRAERIEYRNAWGGAARIWESLFTAHIPKRHEYDSWMSSASNGDNRLWDLSRRADLPSFERGGVHWRVNGMEDGRARGCDSEGV